MKSKAKRNNNRPTSFREKCRNAFAGALKGLANINDGLASRCGVNTKTFDPSLTVAALRGAALQRCSSIFSSM